MELEFIVEQKRLHLRNSRALVGDTVGHYTVSFLFDGEWDGLVKVVAFRNGGNRVQLLYNGPCSLPAQVSGPGELYVACHGYRADGDGAEVVRTMRMAQPVRLMVSEPMAEDGGADFSPSLFSQVVTAAARAEEAARNVQQKLDSGELDGGWYTPRAALTEDGRLQLEFDGSKSTMEPLQFVVPLPAGSGITPEANRQLIAVLRSAVYQTDQSEAIAALETALTVAEGGSV